MLLRERDREDVDEMERAAVKLAPSILGADIGVRRYAAIA
jgi:hypothetical protein